VANGGGNNRSKRGVAAYQNIKAKIMACGWRLAKRWRKAAWRSGVMAAALKYWRNGVMKEYGVSMA